ncbi:MAG TPA: hypothetical protein PLF65_06440, partial [Desulfobacter postgatei]|nr:hypothetical protein [Desulfobacter postgatei]
DGFAKKAFFGGGYIHELSTCVYPASNMNVYSNSVKLFFLSVERPHPLLSLSVRYPIFPIDFLFPEL